LRLTFLLDGAAIPLQASAYRRKHFQRPSGTAWRAGGAWPDIIDHQMKAKQKNCPKERIRRTKEGIKNEKN